MFSVVKCSYSYGLQAVWYFRPISKHDALFLCVEYEILKHSQKMRTNYHRAACREKLSLGISSEQSFSMWDLAEKFLSKIWELPRIVSL